MATELTPSLGEIWEDAEGCLYMTLGEGQGFAFGASHIIDLENDPLVTKPLRRVFLEDGTLDDDWGWDSPLRYPGGHNITKL